MIKEIVDYFFEGEVILKEIIDVRFRQCDIGGVIVCLKVLKVFKWLKLEELQGDDVLFYWYVKSIYVV